MKNAIQSAWIEVNKKRFLFSALILSIIICVSSLDTLLYLFPVTSLLENDYHTRLVCEAMYSDEVNSFVPILSGLPFAANYIEEIKSRFSRYVLIRSSYKSYIISRIVACFLSGGFVVLTGVLNTWGLAALVFGPMENKVDIVTNIRKEFFQSTSILCLIGGFWAVVGMTVSTFMESRYISYATPFVFYYLLVILYERYFSDLFIIYPKTWTDPAVWPFGCWGAVIFLLEMTLLFAFLFAYRSRKRLQQI